MGAVGSSGKFLCSCWLFFLLCSRSIHYRPMVSHNDSKVPFTCSLQPLWVRDAASFINVWPLFSRGVCCVLIQRPAHQCLSKCCCCFEGTSWKWKVSLPKSCFYLVANLIIELESVDSKNWAVFADSLPLLFLCHLKAKLVMRSLFFFSNHKCPSGMRSR